MSLQYTAHIDTFTHDNLPPRSLWPDFRFTLPELRYPERLNCASELLDKALAEGHGERIAIYSAGENLSYAELDKRACQFANLLTNELGLVPGNRVLLRAANTPMLAAAWFGVMKAGGVAVTTMPLLREKELKAIATKARITHALCDERLREELDKAALETGLMQRRALFTNEPLDSQTYAQDFATADTAATDVALLAFTSGTTGEPKATMHFHRDVMAMADVVARHLLHTDENDIYVGSPPLGFTFGLGVSLVFPMFARAGTVLVETPAPDALLNAVQRHRASGIFTAPAMYRAMLPLLDQYDILSLKLCLSAGETLPKPTSDAWFDASGLRIIDGIGATELMHIFISAAGEAIRPGATGKPLPGYKACVLGDDNQPLPPGNTGRLAVIGPTGCRYLADDRQRDYVIDGWNVTGDTYRVDADGYFWFQARADDMILSSGYNIAGPEVEAALLAHDAVHECAVVAVPDADRGHIVKAFVVLAPGFDASMELTRTLQAFVKQTIAPYKYPREIEYVAALPKTQTGKIQRFRLRKNT